MRNRGRRAVTHLTVNGPMRILRSVYGSRAVGWVVPLDGWLGIGHFSVSVGVRQMCCQEALDSSFGNVVRSLKTLAELTLSEDRIRRLVEAEGRMVQSLRKTTALGASFTAADCSDGVLVSGADGVFVPVVSEAQKARRRATEAKKRAIEERRSTRQPGRPKRGADGDYKEAKLATFYSQDKKHLHVISTLGNADELGRLMRREARKVKLGNASFSYRVADGAKWIDRQYRRNLPMLDEHILDWYHFKEHVVETSHAVYGEATSKAKTWQQTMLDAAWEQGSLVMLHKLSPYERWHRGDKRAAFENLRNYVAPRSSMTDYPSFRQQGYDCGSGPTESQCGATTARVKGSGMRWDEDNAEAMLALAALDHSRLWTDYWKLQRAA
jgi:hypothetical protein